ncbi:hypothetical protein TorRG33x02_102390 [Trema orientale]|uniref:Uncharacterized protein n=1 Tax=Trema orientale TaxID=63057 RepID=A0A2P5F7W4_TREOI|nr:hypothetical protein TorRG33x02_102390 [Trema orientale]
MKLVVELSPAAEDYRPAIWQDVIGCVPPTLRQSEVYLAPVTVGITTGLENPDPSFSFEGTAALD